jgi:hypothetical protein
MRRLVYSFCFLVLTQLPCFGQTIDFESGGVPLPDATVVSTQFAAQGVEFTTGRSPEPSYLPEIRVAGVGAARSGTRVLEVPFRESEVTRPGLSAALATTHRTVSLWVRNTTRSGTTFSTRLQLRAFDSSGRRVDGNGGTYATVSNTSSDYTQLIATSAAANIARIALIADPTDTSAGGQRLWIDDLTLDVVPRTSPDFLLGSPRADILQIRAGGAASVLIPIQRLNGSAGPISFNATGLPAGVSAEFDATPTSGVSVMLTLRAASAGPLTMGPLPNVTITGHPLSPSVGPVDRSLQLPVQVVESGGNARVLGMEVTQAVQTFSLPVVDPVRPATPVAYTGVRLFAGSKTIVRVFANAVTTPLPGTPLRAIPAFLEGFRVVDGGATTPLPGPPFILPDGGPRDLAAGPAGSVPMSDRTSSSGAYVFTLPAAWTSDPGVLELRAHVNPPELSSSIAECSGCQADNIMRLSGVRLEPPHAPVEIAPVAIVYTDPRTGTGDCDHASIGAVCVRPRDPNGVFDGVRKIAPLPTDGLRVRPYEGRVVEVTRIAAADYSSHGMSAYSDRRSDVFNAVAQFNWDHNVGGAFTIGVHSGALPGEGWNGLAVGDFGGLESPVVYFGIRVDPVAIVDQGRQLASVSHEFFHGRGYVHAGTDPSCGVPFPNVTWPPDGRGDMDGIGLDRTPGSGGTPGSYRVVAPGTALGEMTDIMSYCTRTEPTKWISVRHWNSWDNIFPDGIPGGSIGAGPPLPAQPTLHVAAVVDSQGGATFLSVKPRESGVVVNADPKSPYSVVVRSSEGDIVSTMPMAVASVHGHEDGMSLSFITGEVPAARATTLQLVSNGKVLATRTRSKNPPLAEFKGALPQQIGPAGVVMQWTASDADGDPLRATVEYSADGKNYRTLTTGVEGNEFRITAADLAHSDSARLRVTVNDGFDETAIVTPPFRVPPSSPKVAILTPHSQQDVRGDVVLSATGQAWDDSGQYLTGKSLSWTADGTFVGTGNTVDLPPLAPGVHTLSLEARDANGMIGRSTVAVIASPVTPMLTSFAWKAPSNRKGNSVAVSVSANVPATLRLASQSCAVGPAPQLCEFKVAPMKRGSKVVFRLRAGDEQAEIAETLPDK